eukprot:754855-Rhodomonas_salina.1
MVLGMGPPLLTTRVHGCTCPKSAILHDSMTKGATALPSGVYSASASPKLRGMFYLSRFRTN